MANRLLLIVLISISLLFSACLKVERIMMVATGIPETITVNSATVGGRVIDVGENATSYGHCYSKSPIVSCSDLRIEKGLPAGNLFYTSTLSGLEPGTKYYYKAYIRNGNTVTYGKEINFTTLPTDPPGNPAGPVCLSSVVEDATPALLEMTFNSNLADIVPDASAFTVIVNYVLRSIISVSVTDSKVLLTLSGTIVYGDNATVAYTRPSGNPLQSDSGYLAETFTSLAVINNVKPASPVYLSSVIEDYTPSLLEVSYDLYLANIVPSVSAFTVMVNSIVRGINTVDISGNKVRLILNKPVRNGDIITVAYNVPSENQLQTPLGGKAATINARSVTNNVK